MEDRRYRQDQRLPGVNDILDSLQPGPRLQSTPRRPSPGPQTQQRSNGYVGYQAAPPPAPPPQRGPDGYQATSPGTASSYSTYSSPPNTARSFEQVLHPINTSYSSRAEDHLGALSSHSSVRSDFSSASTFRSYAPVPPRPTQSERPRDPALERDTSRSAAPSNSNDSLRSIEVPPQTHNAHVLGIADVPGEGRVYMLADGSTLPVVIGGEPVNPAWGVTKAGKPRKRLAQACVTCREKKIKCEPGEPGDSKCSQCYRLNRECRRTADPRMPESAALEIEPPQGQSTRPPPQQLPAQSMSHMLQEADRNHAAPAYAAPRPDHREDISRRREIPPERDYDNRRIPKQDDSSQSTPSAPSSTHRRDKPSTEAFDYEPGKVPVSEFTWEADPYDVDPATTIVFLRFYFHCRASRTYLLFPIEQFMDWVENCHSKSSDDRMMLYAILALGSSYAKEEHLRNIGLRMHKIARRAEEARSSHYSLQLCLTRAHLVQYNFTTSRYEAGYNLTSAAVRSAKILGYLTEKSVRRVPKRDYHEFGLTTIQIIELRRRTTWAIYLLDRYGAYTWGAMGAIHDVEISLRLPVPDDYYKAGVDAPSPLFSGDSMFEDFDGEVGAFALMMDISSTYGIVLGNIFRAKHRSKKLYAASYVECCQNVQERMDNWVSRLPEHLKYSEENTKRSLEQSYFGTYFNLHAIYCIVGMNMGRLGRWEELPDNVIRSNLCKSIFCAQRWLSIIDALSKEVTAQSLDPEVDFAIAQGFPGSVTLAACDVISSGGSPRRMLYVGSKVLESAKQVCIKSSAIWPFSDKHRTLIEGRQQDISAHMLAYSQRDIRIESSMDESYLPEQQDMMYGANGEIFFAAHRDAEAGMEGRLDIDVDVEILGR